MKAKNIKKKVIFLGAIALLGLFGISLSGCSLMPYSGSFSSGGIKYIRGVNGGYVGSLNEVYKQSVVIQKDKKIKKEKY